MFVVKKFKGSSQWIKKKKKEIFQKQIWLRVIYMYNVALVIKSILTINRISMTEGGKIYNFCSNVQI